MRAFARYLRAEHAANPWMLPGVAISGALALSANFEAVIAFVGHPWP